MDSKRHQPIEELDVFQLFESVSDEVWAHVSKWSQLGKDTVGKQLIRAADSIGANLVEGDGRGSDADAVRFFIIARASAREARLWVRRSQKRGLIQNEPANSMVERLERGAKLLNMLINYRRGKSASDVVREEIALYRVEGEATC